MLLDNVLIDKQSINPYEKILKYWENKRMTYNLIMGILGVILSIPYFLSSGTSFIDLVLIGLIGLGANLCYSLGCSVILLGLYYGNENFDFLRWSKTLIILGTLFSIMFLFSMSLLPGLGMILD